MGSQRVRVEFLTCRPHALAFCTMQSKLQKLEVSGDGGSEEVCLFWRLGLALHAIMCPGLHARRNAWQSGS